MHVNCAGVFFYEKNGKPIKIRMLEVDTKKERMWMKKLWNKLQTLNEDGFTLLEMLTVIFIISLLILLIFPNIAGVQDQAEGKTDEAFLSTLQTQVDLYEMDENNAGGTATFENIGLTPNQKIKAEKDFTINGGKVTANGESGG